MIDIGYLLLALYFVLLLIVGLFSVIYFFIFDKISFYLSQKKGKK